MVIWSWGRRRTRHGRHLAEARQWRRLTRGRTWQLASVTVRDGRRVYVWVSPLPGTRRCRYLALDLDASQSMLHMLTVAQRQHDEALTDYLTGPDPLEQEEIPPTGIMMV